MASIADDGCEHDCRWDDADLVAALATSEGFLVEAPLGRRGEVRTKIRAAATATGKRVTLRAPSTDMLVEGESPRDFFWVTVERQQCGLAARPAEY
jgi:hypothetical protein